MSQQDEKGFEVIDKRRVKDNGKDEPETAPEQPEQEQQKEEPEAAAPSAETGSEEQAGQMPPMEPVRVESLLGLFINELAAVAWSRMGLVPDPMSGKIEKDLEQARLAIDSVAALVEKLSPLASEQERRDLQIMVSNLRLNFVKQQ